MPIYEYACKECGKVFEKFVLSRSAEPPKCPDCDSKLLERLYSTFATSTTVPLSSGACAPSGGG
jgi:putative FmdB family regulatory protein